MSRLATQRARRPKEKGTTMSEAGYTRMMGLMTATILMLGLMLNAFAF